MSAERTFLATLNERVARKDSAVTGLKWFLKVQFEQPNRSFENSADTYNQVKTVIAQQIQTDLGLNSAPTVNPISALNEYAQRHRTKYFIKCETAEMKTEWLTMANLTKTQENEAAKALLDKLSPEIAKPDPIGTPLSHLNNLKTRGILNFEIHESEAQERKYGEQIFVVTIRADVRIQKEFKSENTMTETTTVSTVTADRVEISLTSRSLRGPHKNYLSHKAAMDILALASCYNDNVWKEFSILDKRGTLKYGGPFGEEEGLRLELKGSSEVNISRYLAKAAIKHIKAHLSKSVCAFLNSSGGKFIVGVHDNGIVHGVVTSSANRDEIQREVAAALDVVEPKPFSYCNFRFVPVHHSLTINGGEQLVVLEILAVKPSQDCIFTVKRVRYIRVLSATMKGAHENIQVIPQEIPAPSSTCVDKD